MGRRALAGEGGPCSVRDEQVCSSDDTEAETSNWVSVGAASRAVLQNAAARRSKVPAQSAETWFVDQDGNIAFDTDWWVTFIRESDVSARKALFEAWRVAAEAHVPHAAGAH